MVSDYFKIRLGGREIDLTNMNDLWTYICFYTKYNLRLSSKEVEKLNSLRLKCSNLLYEYNQLNIQREWNELKINNHSNKDVKEDVKEELKNAKEDIVEEIELLIQKHMYDRIPTSNFLLKDNQILNSSCNSNDGSEWFRWLFKCFHTTIYPLLNENKRKRINLYKFFIYYRMYLDYLSDEEKQSLFYITETILGGKSLKQISLSLSDWIGKNEGYIFIPDYVLF